MDRTSAHAASRKPHPQHLGHPASARGEEVWHPTPDSNIREAAVAIAIGFAVAVPMLLVGGLMVFGQAKQREAGRLAATRAANAHETLLAAAPGEAIPLDVAMRGRELFVTTCAACHGAEGGGMEGLGRDLIHSDFVALQSDASFHQFIIDGRPLARPMPMPPRAGREDLTDEDITSIVAYVRGLQDPRRMPTLPAFVLTATPSEDDKAAALAASGGDEELAAWIASGNAIFDMSCVACHGKGGVGIPGNGKPLANNAFVQGLDDDSLFDFITTGRPTGDPMNTTGIQMPPKGGNPAMSEDDILDVIAYLRTLQPASAGATAGAAAGGEGGDEGGENGSN